MCCWRIEGTKGSRGYRGNKGKEKIGKRKEKRV
jgi:hypothetical protein